MVAVLAAYKDLASPWAELLKYYQMKEDIRVKYTQIIEQFQPPNLLDQEVLDEDPEVTDPLRGDVISSNLSFAEDDTVKIVDGASFQFSVQQRVAAVGRAGSGESRRSTIMRARGSRGGVGRRGRADERARS